MKSSRTNYNGQWMDKYCQFSIEGNCKYTAGGHATGEGVGTRPGEHAIGTILL